MTKREMIGRIRENIKKETIKPEFWEETEKKFPIEKSPLWEKDTKYLKTYFGVWL